MLAKGFVIVSLILASLSAAAAPAPEKKAFVDKRPRTHIAASATASVINQLGTMDAYFNWLGGHYPEADIKKLRSAMVSDGLKVDEKLPKVTAKGNKVLIGKKLFFVYNKHNVVFNKKTYWVSPTPMNEIVAEVMKNNQKKTAFNFVLMPEAHAYGNGLPEYLAYNVAGGGAGCGLGGLAGYFLGGGWSGAGVGCGIGALVGVTGANIAYLYNHNNVQEQNLGNDYDNDSYHQAGNDFVLGDLAMNGGDNIESMTCDSTNAGYFKVCFKNKATPMWGNISASGCFSVSPQNFQYMNGGGNVYQCDNNTLPHFNSGFNNYYNNHKQHFTSTTAPEGAVIR